MKKIRNNERIASLNRKSILSLSAEEARLFFLKHESYCNINLPPYFNFSQILSDTQKELNGKSLSSLIQNPRDCDRVNYTIINNKDGKYSWRQFQLIHPVLYVALVNKITEKNNWKFILKKFKQFTTNNISCVSIPIISLSRKKDKAEQILQWIDEIEQKSLKLSIEYDYLIQTDITDCYGSIYTHTIAWALHTKKEAKKKENRNNKNLIGVAIDHYIQDMQHGQTNGIPQGSVLMDFIAEIILGYVDLELSLRLKKKNIVDYYILRYRDDYRLFVNNLQTGEAILKILTETLCDIGMKINFSKTNFSNDVVSASLKSDKLNWLIKKNTEKELLKQMLIIHDHARLFPNSGSLEVALKEFWKRVKKYKYFRRQPLTLICIVADIGYRNPRTHAYCAAIISDLLIHIPTKLMKRQLLEKIKSKFNKLSHTGFMLIWLQRVSYPIIREVEYDEPLCKLVYQNETNIWNHDWIKNKKLKNLLKSKKIIDMEKLKKLPITLHEKEVSLFFY